MYSLFSVDDEPIVHQMLAQIVEESGLPVTLVGNANSGAQALELIPKLRPDICLLDIHMDGMDGFELASSLQKALDYKPHIIYLTAYDYFDYAQKAMRLGAEDYILKPINRKELISTLRRVIAIIQSQRLEKTERDTLKKKMESVMPLVITDASAAGRDRNTNIALAVQSYVDEHYHEKLTLAGAAAHVNLSQGYFGSIFKAACGISFRAYLRSVRISRAKELLQDHSLNISEIAHAVGYDDLNYFSQVFFEETGIRPSEYRGGGRGWAR